MDFIEDKNFHHFFNIAKNFFAYDGIFEISVQKVSFQTALKKDASFNLI